MTHGIYLQGVEDALDLREVGNVPSVLGERAQRKSVISHKHCKKSVFQLGNHQV